MSVLVAPSATADLRRRRSDDASAVRLPRVRSATREDAARRIAVDRARQRARLECRRVAGISVRYALAEARSPRPGGAGVLAKLAEVLFIEMLRLYMHEQGEGRTGWLAGVNDRIVGAALAALHKHPAQAWTLEDLARAAGTSRSVLAERFQQLVGTSPMQYLTQWRMMLAANLLRHSNTPLAHIAEGVGYQTDTAFIRAFRREFGAPPAAWRRSQVKRDQAL